MKIPTSFLHLVAGALLLSAAPGCTSGFAEMAQARAELQPGFAAPAVPQEAPDAAARRRLSAVTQESSPVPTKAVADTRLMIYTASFEVLVSNVEDTLKQFLAWVESDGGYLEARENKTVTCRIPADRFDALVARIPSIGTVLSESLKAQDVTLQSFDLAVRIENAEKSRQRLLHLLEQATDVEAILKIEQELRRLTVELERMKGELKLLQNRVAYSTVQVTFRSNAPDPTPTPRRTQSRFGWIRQVGIEHVLQDF